MLLASDTIYWVDSDRITCATATFVIYTLLLRLVMNGIASQQLVLSESIWSILS